MRQVNANGLWLSALGQGGWTLGDDPAREPEEIAALQLGVSLGMTLIDTAEMYGQGRSEQIIGRAIKDMKREEIKLVSKVFPYNAGRGKLKRSCVESLRRLDTEYLDLYLLHWRGEVPLAETVEGMESLVRAGMIRRWGVSNFDVSDMEDLWSVPNGSRCAANQVLYHIGSRGIEYDLLPWLAAHEVAVMAYCPLAQAGRVSRMGRNLWNDNTLRGVAERCGATIPQLLLAFTLRQSHVLAIPQSGNVAHVRDNASAADIRVSDEDWRALDAVFWPPTGKMHLDIE